MRKRIGSKCCQSNRGTKYIFHVFILFHQDARLDVSSFFLFVAKRIIFGNFFLCFFVFLASSFFFFFLGNFLSRTKVDY